jgi:hypothetical protein
MAAPRKKNANTRLRMKKPRASQPRAKLLAKKSKHSRASTTLHVWGA